MIGFLVATPPERRLLPRGKLSAPTPWLIAIMMFVMVTVGATGPSHCSRVARSSASGTATARVTPGAERAAVTARASLERPSAIWIE